MRWPDANFVDPSQISPAKAQPIHVCLSVCVSVHAGACMCMCQLVLYVNVFKQIQFAIIWQANQVEISMRFPPVTGVIIRGCVFGHKSNDLQLFSLALCFYF